MSQPHPILHLSSLERDGLVAVDLLEHLASQGWLDLAMDLSRHAEHRATRRWIARRLRERDEDWRASGKLLVNNRRVRKARRASDWVAFRSACGVLREGDLARLWRDVRAAFDTARPAERLWIARHFYQTCENVSVDLIADCLSWNTKEVRERLGTSHLAAVTLSAG